MAVSGDDQNWFLINASPDLTQQIEANPELYPDEQSPRNSPIAGVLLTNADLDHSLGLLLLRQQPQRVRVYATETTRGSLEWIDALLLRFSKIGWQPVTADFSSLGNNLAFRIIELEHSAVVCLRDEASGKTAIIAPAVSELNDELRELINACDLVLFDGTFWSDAELLKTRRNARSAREMNHLPIHDGSLDFLSQSPARRKIYIHINNTNPILMPGSPENVLLQKAGIEVARDGMEIVL